MCKNIGPYMELKVIMSIFSRFEIAPEINFGVKVWSLLLFNLFIALTETTTSNSNAVVQFYGKQTITINHD